MKKIVFFVLLSFSITVKSQTIYHDRKEYDVAIKNYNDALDSYDNYVKKINFYKNYKYPKNKPYPLSWYDYFKPLLETNGIRLDNYKVRYHENVTPDGTIYINFIVDPNSDVLSVTFSDITPKDYIYSASIYKFNHPGKSPIFVEKQKEEEVVVKVDTNLVTPKETIVTKLNIIKVPAITLKENVYFMPDGKKYSYEQLIYYYPSMAYNSVFHTHFDKQ